MTAEELAEIKDRAARVVKRAKETCVDLDDYQLVQAMDAPPLARFILSLPDTDAQAQRIAELEAQLAARGTDREAILQTARGECEMSTVGDDVPERACMNDNCMCERIVDALLSSGALATAPALVREHYTAIRPITQDDIDKFNAAAEHAVPMDFTEMDARLATAQAVTLTEEDRAFIAEHHGRIYLMPGEQAKLWVIIDRITGASTPAHPTEGENL